MAFDKLKLSNVQGTGVQKNVTIWAYTSESDSIATITASGYFNPDTNDESDPANLIKVSDFINIAGSDAGGVVATVTALDPTTVSTIGEAPGSLAQGSTFIGNSSNLPVGVDISGNGQILIGNGTTATAHAVSGDVTLTNAGVSAIGAGKVLLAMLGAGISPASVTKYTGKITWSGSGASLATTVNGVLATDVVICTIQTAPTQAAYLVSAAPTTNTITITLSAANTSNNAVIGYQVFRAAA